MSRAFVKEQDDAVEELPERSISEHPNDVTPEGATRIDAELAAARTHMPPRRTLAIARLWHQHPVTCGTGPHEGRPLGSFRRRKIMIGFTSAPQ
jgi:hypothetical protein